MKTLIPVPGFAPIESGWRRPRVRPRGGLTTISSLPGCHWTRKPGQTRTGKTSRRSSQACDGPLDSDGFFAGCKRVRPDNEGLVDNL